MSHNLVSCPPFPAIHAEPGGVGEYPLLPTRDPTRSLSDLELPTPALPWVVCARVLRLGHRRQPANISETAAPSVAAAKAAGGGAEWPPPPPLWGGEQAGFGSVEGLDLSFTERFSTAEVALVAETAGRRFGFRRRSLARQFSHRKAPRPGGGETIGREAAGWEGGPKSEVTVRSGAGDGYKVEAQLRSRAAAQERRGVAGARFRE